MKIYCLDIYDESCPESTRQRRFTSLKAAKKGWEEERVENGWRRKVAPLWMRITLEEIPTTKKEFIKYMADKVLLGT